MIDLEAISLHYLEIVLSSAKRPGKRNGDALSGNRAGELTNPMR